MGWSLGEDSNGRQIGYSVEAHCDRPGCTTVIDRGLAYACGEEPGYVAPDANGEGGSCEGFFCEEHKYEHEAAPGEPCDRVTEMNRPVKE